MKLKRAVPVLAAGLALSVGAVACGALTVCHPLRLRLLLLLFSPTASFFHSLCDCLSVHQI